jgi:putative nucleotidyltransferase with HDIG domain
VLGAQSRAEVVEVLLSRVRDVVSCDTALMLMPPVGAGADARDGWRIARGPLDGAPHAVTLSERERAEITTVSESGFAVPVGGHRTYLRSTPSLRAEVFPVRVNGATECALILGIGDETPFDDEERRNVRQIVAQVAVAFSNLHLVDELRALNSGTLEALARTTDAASPWTAGHSVRVTAIAVALAQADGRDDETVDLVRRGALLHDIGKLAVPVAILDKPSALTAEERAVMNTHPAVGARILQPITAFAPLLPMVRSHHERWDGRGYPDQLRGEDIPTLARLLAVADVAESMLAARPYRAPLPLSYVVGFIRENAGKHFDPHFANLFADRVSGGDSGLLNALDSYAKSSMHARLLEVA